MNTDCPFCLANNLLEVEILAETKGAFLLPARNFPGNFLIVPKVHAESVAELPDDWWGDFKQLFAQLPEPLQAFNISLNYGKAAGQTLAHLHFWIVPRAADVPSSGKGLATLIKAVDTANDPV